VKILYCAAQAENDLPQETLFEINAAFDHLSRHWTSAEDEEHVVEKAYSHLKRSCLDIFKLKLRDTVEKYQRLSALDTSIIDNGEFDKRLHSQMYQLRTDATEARRAETADTHEDGDGAQVFDLWQPIYERCLDLEKDSFLNPNLDWAKKKTKSYGRKVFLSSLAGSFVAGLFLSPLLWRLCSWLAGLLKQVENIPQ